MNNDINALTSRAKRAFDLVVAVSAMAVTLPLYPLIAIAIKLDSPGPVFFRQMRIGRARHDRTDLFEMIKFRTMRQDAEARSGAVWAKKSDSRITRIGNFLRKTRLDELPQLINVIRGEMSIIGPRPERPGFYRMLEREIPYFAERTVGVAPGITGLAQVNQGYDTCLDDVRSKLGFDHRYALALASPRDWLMMDLHIAWRTLGVMVTGRGQ
jgi:lipopolysaccharide/colanic/teichoic acid biosynthesis glycosyltransferase